MPDRAAAPLPDDLVVSTGWLEGHLDDPAVRVLDCRFYFDDLERGRRAYLEGHIPGAAYMDWTRDVSEPRGALQYMASSAEHFRAALERLGVSDATTVIGYDDEGGHYVSRLWLIARVHGFDGVRMLDGGWTKWVHEGRPSWAGEEATPERGHVAPREGRPGLLVSADEILAARDDPRVRLLDVRRWSELTGDEVRSKHGGRVPWSQWLLWQDNLTWEGDRDFRPLQEIRTRYEEAGVTPDTRVITYCHGAVRAAHTAFALTRLGYQNVQVYDGSWEEWGGRDDLPIATGEP